MKPSKLNIATVIFVFFTLTLSLQAQNGQYDEYNQNSSYGNTSNINNNLAGVSEKVVSSMEELKNTHFMKEYMGMQIEIEETIKMVKSNAHLYNPEGISQIKIAYRKTAMEFNRVLEDLKKNLLKGKYKANKSVYSHQNLERKLLLLTRFYQTNFKEPIAAIVQGEDIEND
ncbi:MAG: hypothetical protein ACPG49_09405 [Chitinophagales bacterium]